MPDVSVVVATHNRADRLVALLDALARQSFPRDRFEVVVVDDASTDRTPGVLAAFGSDDTMRLLTIRRESSAGPATARDEGWRAASGAIIAFTDDDCAPAPGWVDAGVRASREEPGAIIQGRTEPSPEEINRLGPFSRTIRVEGPDPAFQTCNIFYPREVLERIDGFDTHTFDRSPGGEDSDLAWRAIKAGARSAFAADAVVFHAVNQLGPLGKLRVAARWTTPMFVYARHPEFRRTHFTRGIFWKGSHYLLARALVGVALPRRLRFLSFWLAYPYLRHLVDRGRVEGGGPLLAPYFVLHDVIEMATVARAAARYRTPML